MATDTIFVSGNGTGTLSRIVSGPGVTGVEAVLAEIDTGGTGDTIATLTVTSPTGLDVAAVPQGSPVSGGGLRRATWALRLAEDDGGGGTTQPLAVFDDTTTVFPALGLHAVGGLVVTDEGFDTAGLNSTASQSYCVGHWNAYNFAGPSGALVPLVQDSAADVGVSGARWIVHQTGFWWMGFAGSIGIVGPCPRFRQWGLVMEKSTGAPSAQATDAVETALAGGEGYAHDVSASGFVQLTAGDAIQVSLATGSFPVGGTFASLGGRAALIRVF